MQNDEQKNAAFFDFDGMFFQPGTSWKVANPLLGKIGTRIPYDKSFKLFEEIRGNDQKADVSDYFTLNEFEYKLIDEIKDENILPQSQLLHFARNHISRRDDLFVVTPPGFLNVIVKNTDLAFEQLKNFTLFENPFKRVSRIYPHPECDMILNQTERQNTKIDFYKAHLKYHKSYEDTQSIKISQYNPTQIFYNKIFLYHTELELNNLIQDAVRKEMDLFSGGRNAIIPQLIARTNGI